MKVKIGKTTFALERGDITDAEVDAIVNAANSELWMGTGVAGAIKRKGGVVIEEEALRQGPDRGRRSRAHRGGNLAATHVIHAATMGKDLKTDPEKIAGGHEVVPGDRRQAPADVDRLSRPRERGRQRASGSSPPRPSCRPSSST